MTAASSEHDGSVQREQLIAELRQQGIRDQAVLRAVSEVPRDEFVSPRHRAAAWENHPLPIGSGQTISQPFIAAYMVTALGVMPGDRVLDVGTGCGYQAAVLAACGADVVSVEVRPELAESADETLRRLGYSVEVVVADGHGGWPDGAPYAGIAVAAVAANIPPALLEQLVSPRAHRRGGRLILPLHVSGGFGNQQRLVLVERMRHAASGGSRDLAPSTSLRAPDLTTEFRQQKLIDVAFVPLIEAEELT
ncbi:MAG: protein-L-isoaspartate O-methyltransferase [Actinomycetia bacterium]|nr:protein-L-isoaspartate O-methyltransferase [Actinomycetes bacterium]